jgi:hypothetical protein
MQWRLTGSNRRHSACKADALPAELNLHTAGKNDPYGNRTRVTAVKGRCLNRLTNGPIFYSFDKATEKEGFEPSRRVNDLHP